MVRYIISPPLPYHPPGGFLTPPVSSSCLSSLNLSHGYNTYKLPAPLSSVITKPLLSPGDQFWKIPECFVRGNTIKYLRIPDEVIDLVKDEPVKR